MNLSVAAFINSLQGDSGYAENTRQAYANDLQCFYYFLTKKLGRDPQTSDLSSEIVTKYFEFEKNEGLKLSTIHRRRATLKRYSQYLIEHGEIQETLVTKNLIKSKKNDVVPYKFEVQKIKAKDIEKLLNLIKQSKTARSFRDLAIVNLLLETGLSVATLVGINLSDLNFNKMVLRIENIQRQENYYNISQSEKSIQHYLKLGRADLTQISSEKAIFVSQLGKRITRQGVWQILRNWGKEAGLSVPLSPRHIRHTAAQRMLDQGKSINEIQRLLGHRNQLSTRFLVRRLKTTNK
ncbi:MAG: tyrosine-type recombinase/integrase [Chloroflexota bacterium]